MDLSKSQQEILQRLKVRGPQSIKILSKHMKQTTMGVRQHLTDMRSKGFATQTKTERQTRGRPLNLWRLTKKGHQCFENNHTQTTLNLIETIQKLEGGDGRLRLAFYDEEDDVEDANNQHIEYGWEHNWACWEVVRLANGQAPLRAGL